MLNFRAPDLNWKNFSGGPDIYRNYKICSKNKRKFKMQQHFIQHKWKGNPQKASIDVLYFG